MISLYVIYFFIYSILGTAMESITILIEDKKLILNRGYLIGPYIPIYGFGALLIIILISNLTTNIFFIFIFSMLLCGVLEYMVSFLLEKIFQMKWWDYSKNKYNINGRVELNRLLSFGIMGIVVIKIFQPLIEKFIFGLSNNMIFILSILIIIILSLDLIASTIITLSLRKRATKSKQKDITSLIKNELNNIFYKRILKTFPYIKNNFLKNIINQINQIKK